MTARRRLTKWAENGAAGSMLFATESDGVPSLSRLIYFTESLATFGTGYLLPPLPPE